MATTRNHQAFLKQAFRVSTIQSSDEEFEESDVWSCQPEPRKPPSASRPQLATRKKSSASTSGSMPVDVPDWSKILLHEYEGTRCNGSSYGDWIDHEEEDEEEIDITRLPPHEMARRRRAASLSVVEGVGRTLKGRDLSRVRNAIWARTGFQD